jgi:hypothetical protein
LWTGKFSLDNNRVQSHNNFSKWLQFYIADAILLD